MCVMTIMGVWYVRNSYRRTYFHVFGTCALKLYDFPFGKILERNFLSSIWLNPNNSTDMFRLFHHVLCWFNGTRCVIKYSAVVLNVELLSAHNHDFIYVNIFKKYILMFLTNQSNSQPNVCLSRSVNDAVLTPTLCSTASITLQLKGNILVFCVRYNR